MFIAKRIVLLCFVLFAVFGLAADNGGPAVLVDHGHFKRARAMLEKRLAANPKDADALVLMARVKLAYNDADEATRLLQQALAVQPNHSGGHLFLAEAYSRKVNNMGFFDKIGLAKKIKGETEKAMAADPKNIDALEGMMHYYLEAPGIMGGSRSKADEMAERIIAVDPIMGNLAKGEIAAHEKEYDKVEGLYWKALQAGPQSYDALLAVGSLYAGGRWKNDGKSADYALKAQQIDPSRSGTYNLLAQNYAARERWDDLDRLLTRAEKNVPDNLFPYFLAGRSLMANSKDPVRAEKYFRKYLTQQEPEGETPPLAFAHWRLGLTLEKQGKKQEAIQEIQIALQMKPDIKEAQKDLKRLKS
jgi:tetratricopeptide (TPR) repeat protein